MKGTTDTNFPVNLVHLKDGRWVSLDIIALLNSRDKYSLSCMSEEVSFTVTRSPHMIMQ